MKKLRFSTLTTAFLIGTVFLLPLFCLPLTSDLFDFNKRFLFFSLTLAVTLIFAAQIFFKKQLHISRNPWTLPVALFGLGTLGTLLFVSPNRLSALSGSGGLYLAFALLFMVGSSLVRKNFTHRLITALSLASVIVTLTSLLEYFGANLTHLLNDVFGLLIPVGMNISLTGSPLFAVFFLSLVSVMLMIRFYQTRGQRENFTHLFFTIICLIGIGINIPNLLPSSPTHPQFLSFLDSWSIATDVVKTPLNAVLGIGTDNYANAFSLFKPVRLNQTATWFVRFNNGSDSVLEILVTQGVLGLIAWILILLTSLRLIKTATGEQLALGVGTLIIEVLLLCFPPDVLLVSLFCLFLIAWSASLKERGILAKETVLTLLAFKDPRATTATWTNGVLVRGLSLGLVLLVGVGVYAMGRAYAGEYYFNQSLIAAHQGNGKHTYDAAVQALILAPYMENYHRAFAITNLSLAQAVSQNKNLGNQDKQNIITLVSQAIGQAKLATALDPLDTANWETLTTIYQALIGSADGADQWTIASFVEQAKTDPSNPQVRFDLGSVYRQLGNNDMALKLYEQAAQLKPNYANAYYNLADLYKQKGDKTNEFAMLQATLSLITPSQTGYQEVKSRYNQLQAELATPSPAKPSTPAPTPTPSPTSKAMTKHVIPTATPATTLNLPDNAGLQPTSTLPAVPKK